MEGTQSAPASGTPPLPRAQAVEPEPSAPPSSERLDRLLRRAGWLGAGGDQAEPVVSFTAVFLAFFTGDDDFARWVQDKATWIGPSPDDVIRDWSAAHGRPPELTEARLRAARGLSAEQLAMQQVVKIRSCERLLREAGELLARVGGDTLDVRHVWAVYLYRSLHGADLEAWRFDREAWAARFRCHVAGSHPDEAVAWRRIHDEVFPRAHSIGVNETLWWASALAQRRSPRASEVDGETVLAGMLCDGLAYLDHNVTSGHLVRCLGGAAVAKALIGHDPGELGRMRALHPSAELEHVFDRARVLATATRPAAGAVPELHVRHLLVALLLDPGHGGAFELLRSAGRSVDGVLAQIVASLDKLETNDDAGRWRALLDELRDHVVAGYDNDEAHGEDRLGIGSDVRALAAVLASTQVTPPLSVGLFGEWGSGKSFFMRKLRDRIDQLARAAKGARTSLFCGQKGRVLQIKFNAWHYVDADLWSSLAAGVFDALSREFKQEFAQACVDELDALKDRKRELTSEQVAVVERARKIDGEIGRQREQREQRSLAFSDYLKGLEDHVARDIAANPKVIAVSRRLGAQVQLGRVELETLRGDVETTLGRARRWWATLRSPVRLAMVGCLLAWPAVIAGLVSLYASTAWGAGGAIVGVAGALGVLRQWVAGTVPGAAQVDRALAAVDEIERHARERRSAEEQALAAERQAIAARIAELEHEQLHLSKRGDELETQLAALTDERSLKDFVVARAASDDYRKRLGTVSVVHQDFQQLATFLAPGGNGPDVERIILYIDDLDRCPPVRVVEVLQAVHIILSLPLFVVVVGVDSRWLLDSLAAYYRQQFPVDVLPPDSSRPQQYLEKIFQIPFTMMPMSPDTFGSLVCSLLERHVEAPRGGAAAGGGDLRRPEKPGAAAQAAERAASTAIAASRVREAEDRIDLAPRSLRIEPEELRYIRQLSELIASPRAAKRLVNLYRIVRATLDDRALDRLISGGYRITQICLAIVIGSPGFGSLLFQAILSRQLTCRLDLVRWCGDRGTKDRCRGVRDLEMLRQVAAKETEFADWTGVCDAVYRVSRFSFETGMMLGHHMSTSRHAAGGAPDREPSVESPGSGEPGRPGEPSGGNGHGPRDALAASDDPSG